MADISNRDIAQSLRSMAWERAKGELNGLLHTYWPLYLTDGTVKDEGFEVVNKKISGFIRDLDDLLS